MERGLVDPFTERDEIVVEMGVVEDATRLIPLSVLVSLALKVERLSWIPAWATASCHR